MFQSLFQQILRRVLMRMISFLESTTSRAFLLTKFSRFITLCIWKFQWSKLNLMILSTSLLNRVRYRVKRRKEISSKIKNFLLKTLSKQVLKLLLKTTHLQLKKILKRLPDNLPPKIKRAFLEFQHVERAIIVSQIPNRIQMRVKN